MSPVLSAMHRDRVVGAQGLGWSSGLETALKEKRRLCAPWHRGWVERQDGMGVSLHVSPAQ